MSERVERSPEPPETASVSQVLDSVREHLGRIRFGAISLTVHDGKVVQLEIVEKTRFA